MKADLSVDELRGILTVGEQGRPARLRAGLEGYAVQASAMINVAMALAEAYPGGLGTVAEVLGATGRNAEINHL